MRGLCCGLLISACALLAQDAGEPVDAAAWLNRGVQAFKSARYDEAVEAFQRSLDLDPSNLNARMFLATSFFAQYVPGADSPENNALADKARSGFERVLSAEPDNKTAMQYLASIAYQTATSTADTEEKFRRLEEARSWYEKLAAIDPQNKEAWYSLGVIDWMKWYPKYKDALKQAAMTPDDAAPFSDSSLREDLKRSSGQVIEDGILNLRKALSIDSQYADAMAYMNLLVRERASLDDSEEQYKRDIAIADDWVRQSMDAKKAEAAGDTTTTTATPPPSVPSRIRVGGNVQAANLIKKVIPVYPPKAKEAHVQGTVRFQVIIGNDGLIKNVQLVSGHPLLVRAAQDAVQQWVYKPTLLNGEPVEVITTVDVGFSLDTPHM
jgi:TonB family protein